MEQIMTALSRFPLIIAEFDRSLRAIMEGHYSFCAGSSELIAVKRLQVMPWATYCLSI